MDYNEALQYIHRTDNFAKAPGLERMKDLCKQLGDPQNELKIIHVAGTNGKGSTVTMIACALEDAGFRVGKYTSPYVYDFRERIEINGQMIKKDSLADVTGRVKAVCDSMEEAPTEFELVTAIAFLYFKEQGCDYVVLEVGLGGRLDATNIITAPLLSVICSISLDHTHILGDTEVKIAGEKAGIIKEHCPLIAYCKNEEQVNNIFKERCKELNSPIHFADLKQLKLYPPTDAKNVFEYKGIRYSTTFYGMHQIYNALNAITALEVLGIESKFIVSGVNRATAHARYEVICERPRIIIDAGHNRDGVEQLIKTLGADKNVKGLTVIFGMLKDKAYQYAIRELASIATRMVCVKVKNPRALSSYDMKNIAQMFCTECYGFDSMEEAVDKALKVCDENDTILVCGSFYIIEDAVKELKRRLETTK